MFKKLIICLIAYIVVEERKNPFVTGRKGKNPNRAMGTITAVRGPQCHFDVNVWHFGALAQTTDAVVIL